MYCSALVQHLYRKAGVDLAPGVDIKNTTPEDIARTLAPHVTYVLERETARSKLKAMKSRLHRHLHDGVARLKKRGRRSG